MNTPKLDPTSATCLLVYAIGQELWQSGKTGDREYAVAIAALMIKEISRDPLFAERCEEYLDELKFGNLDVA